MAAAGAVGVSTANEAGGSFATGGSGRGVTATAFVSFSAGLFTPEIVGAGFTSATAGTTEAAVLMSGTTVPTPGGGSSDSAFVTAVGATFGLGLTLSCAFAVSGTGLATGCSKGGALGSAGDTSFRTMGRDSARDVSVALRAARRSPACFACGASVPNSARYISNASLLLRCSASLQALSSDMPLAVLKTCWGTK